MADKRNWQTLKDKGDGMSHNCYHKTRGEARKVAGELKRQGYKAVARPRV